MLLPKPPAGSQYSHGRFNLAAALLTNAFGIPSYSGDRWGICCLFKATRALNGIATLMSFSSSIQNVDFLTEQTHRIPNTVGKKLPICHPFVDVQWWLVPCFGEVWMVVAITTVNENQHS